MRLNLLFSLIFTIPICVFSQVKTDNKYPIVPYVSGLTDVKEGNFDIGIEFLSKSVKNKLKLTLRVPLVEGSSFSGKIDRYTESTTGIVSYDRFIPQTQADETKGARSWLCSFGGEYGHKIFFYYPTAKKDNKQVGPRESFAGEIKISRYYSGDSTNGIDHRGRQYSPQFRIRYSANYKAAKEFGVSNSSLTNGIPTTSNWILEKPSLEPVFSPAFCYGITWNNNTNLAFFPALYWDVKGEKNQFDPFLNGTSRLRFEGWICYYPLLKEKTSFRIGVAPFVSQLISDKKDDFNELYGGVFLSIKLTSDFRKFF